MIYPSGQQECQFCLRKFANLSVHHYMSSRCGEQMKNLPQFQFDFGRLKTSYSDEYKETFKVLRKAGTEVKKFRMDLRRRKVQIWISKVLAKFFNYLISIDQKDEEIALIMSRTLVDELFRLKIMDLFGHPNQIVGDFTNSWQPDSRLISAELSIKAKEYVHVGDGVHVIFWNCGKAEACCEYLGAKFIVYSRELETEARLNMNMPGCHRQALLEIGKANDL